VIAIGPGSSFSNFYFNGVATIAGAQLWSVDELKDYFRVDDGLLVLRVLPGTPAERAGLRSGDVIVRADGRTISSLRTFQHALERANDRSGDHTVPVDIVRKGEVRRVTLAW
jgi:serine protease Do